MGLMARKMPERQDLPVAQVAQLHRWSPLLFHDHGQFFTAAAQGWILLAAILQSTRGAFSRADATCDHKAADQGDQQLKQGRMVSVQSSKRELLSRGRELRGVGRSDRAGGVAGGPEGSLPLGIESFGGRRVGEKEASSASGRSGLPWGIPGRAEEDPGLEDGCEGEDSWLSAMGPLPVGRVAVGLLEVGRLEVGRLPRR